jgi:dTDP-4-amino-4,6-dideoxygalactose transaminase
VIGWNARLDGFQGTVLSVKLKHLNGWNEARRSHAATYSKLLSGVPGVKIPTIADYAKHVFHIYAVRIQGRDKLIADLGEKGISCGIHYPVPIHLQKAYAFLNLKEGSFPVAEKCASEYVSLPMFPELKPEQVEYVAEKIKELLK